MIYLILTIIVASWAVIHGFRMGFSSQIPTLIGISVGILCSHIFLAPASELLQSHFPLFSSRTEADFAYGTIAGSLVYLISFRIFSFATRLIANALDSRDGILNSLGGAMVGLLNKMILLSIALNIWFCFNIRSELLNYANHDDGNIVGSVMLITAPVLGSESLPSLCHKLQLEEAKCIS